MFTPTPYKLFFVQLFCWLSIIPFYILASANWIIMSIVFYVIYLSITSLTIHRLLCHRAFIVSPIVRKLLIIGASLSTTGSAIPLVSLHRAHHRFSDTKQDPHSPKYMSIWRVLFGTMFSEVKIRYAMDLVRDPFCKLMHRYYFLTQIPVILFWYFVGGYVAVFACHVVPSGLTWIAISCVNYFNHTSGYVTTVMRDTSKNNLITGYLTLGEGWHNNHHTSSASPYNKVNWWEFDFIYYVGCMVGTPVKRINR